MWRVQRLFRMQRLRTWRQGLRSLRGLRGVRLRLLHFVGRLPVYLLGANSSPIVSKARGLSKVIASFTAARLHADGQGWRLYQGLQRMLDRSRCVRYVMLRYVMLQSQRRNVRVDL